MAVLVLTKRILRFNLSSEGVNEPRTRTYLRWSFGALWLVDGILQFQASMPLGLANNVVSPAAASTPSWLHSLMLHAIFLWNTHPVSLAVGVAWLQVGFGLALLVSNGRVGRFVGGASAVWATLVWFIGNGAGGIFVSGASFLFGWPGASLFYVIAGVWLALDYDTFRRRFSVVTMRLLAVIVTIGVVFQALPSGEFWHGGNTNALATMSRYMTAIAQPHALAFVVRHVGSLAALMGGGFNIVVILWMLTCAIGLWFGATRQWNWPVWTIAIGCLFFWITSEDTSLFGGLATDVNSLIPVAVLAVCCAPRLRMLGARTRSLPGEIANSAGAVVATFASAMIIFAAVSMLMTTFAGAETILFQAQNGAASRTSVVAPRFTLTDQFDRSYSLGEHKNYVTLLAFLDPRCFTVCPLLAQQIRELRAELPANAKIDCVAVAVDPYHERLSDLRHFIAIHDMSGVKNFYYVTGKLAIMHKVWKEYGIGVTMNKSDAMSIHSDYMFLINSKGILNWVIPDQPVASSSSQASTVAELKSLLDTEGIH
jgi:cytochrome oxidase Cu insertion factor (SCO1/SenC/PrrC family)